MVSPVFGRGQYSNDLNSISTSFNKSFGLTSFGIKTCQVHKVSQLKLTDAC